MLHVQFESIHPFLDGNGRLGRLLVTLLLVDRGILGEPILYPSLYLKQHKARYYELLQQVRLKGIWEDWVEFFLDAIATTAEQAVQLSKRILELFRADEKQIQEAGTRSQLPAVYRAMQVSPVTRVSQVVGQTKLSVPTVLKALEKLRALNILDEVTGRERNRIYRYRRYVEMLSEGTEL